MLIKWYDRLHKQSNFYVDVLLSIKNLQVYNYLLYMDIGTAKRAAQ